MTVAVRSIRQAKVRCKRVIIRVDMNVPFDHKGRIRDDFRIRESLATIRFVLRRGGSVFVLLHRGRPVGRDPKLSIIPIAERAAKILGVGVRVVSDLTRERPEKYQKMRVLFSENIRFFDGEEKDSPKFAKVLAGWGDLYVNDALAVSHRAAASIVAITKFLPSYTGLLLASEISALDRVLKNPRRPFVVILGGAKAETKIPYVALLLKKADELIPGGVILNTLWAGWGHETGKSVVEKSQFSNAKKLNRERRLLIPDDVSVLTGNIIKGPMRVIPLASVGRGDYILDLGPASVRKFAPILYKTRTVLWNGPLGNTDRVGGDRATRALAKILKRSRARIVVGGGDLEAALKKEKVVGSRVFVSTGGGAMLEYVAFGTLPGIEALKRE